jgi:hypothetical protein
MPGTYGTSARDRRPRRRAPADPFQAHARLVNLDARRDYRTNAPNEGNDAAGGNDTGRERYPASDIVRQIQEHQVTGWPNAMRAENPTNAPGVREVPVWVADNLLEPDSMCSFR